MPGQQIIFSSPSSNKQSYVKIVQAGQANSNAKTITLTQAQKLGLLSGGKLQQILPAVSGGKVSLRLLVFLFLNIISGELTGAMSNTN